MINLHELEARHRRYKVKQRKPYYIAFLALILILALGAFLWSIALHNKAKTPAQPLVEAPTVAPIETLTVEPNVTAQAPLQESAVQASAIQEILVEEKPLSTLPQSVAELTPDFSFMRSIDTSARDTSTHPSATPTPPPAQKPKESTPVAPTAPKSANLSLSSTSNSSQTITQLIARFDSSKNAQLGVVIAHYYYDKKAYAKAYNYAFQANAIDQNDPQSWMIAAQSLYMLNKKEEAIKLLRLFTRDHDAPQAKTLLTSMEKGTFK
ncbi:MAG: hypothetical protein KU37_08840 [Sulfuricurvum sp. PC08-66]|nr:MAG: hypothetical protein KU37_08840 [Sulfuricurvum sp. PC08-66]